MTVLPADKGCTTAVMNKTDFDTNSIFLACRVYIAAKFYFSVFSLGVCLELSYTKNSSIW